MPRCRWRTSLLESEPPSPGIRPSRCGMKLIVSRTGFPASGFSGYCRLGPRRDAHHHQVTRCAAPAGAAARACGPSSFTRSSRVCGPRELLSTTSYPAVMANRATLPPMRPAADEANRRHAAGLAILGYALLRSDLPMWIGLDAYWQHDAAICADTDLPRHSALDVLPGDSDIRNSARRAYQSNCVGTRWRLGEQFGSRPPDLVGRIGPHKVPLVTRVPIRTTTGPTARGSRSWPPERPTSTRRTFSCDGRLSGRRRAPSRDADLSRGLAYICVCCRDRRTGCSRRGCAAASRELSVHP